MAKFQYTSKKELEPRPGVKFSTTYYKQTQAEYTRLRQHIYRIAAEIMAICDSDLDQYRWANTPMKEYKKSVKGEYYTPMEIITDMVEQFAKQKDLPSGMLGRWQRLFAGTEWDIELTTEPIERTTVTALFDLGE